MKFVKTIIKNFKILFRLKTSLIAVIFGPLLVIFLIGFAFNSGENIQLSIGYNAPDDSALTQEFIATMETNNYILKSFPDQTTCETELKHGLIHTCIMFPKDFVIARDKTNNVTFIVDKSRVNLVYTVIESVSTQIGIKSDELSRSLTETLTSTLEKTATGVDSSIGSLIKIKKEVGDSVSDADVISSDLGNIDLSSESVSFSGVADLAKLTDYTDDIYDDLEDAIDEAFRIIDNDLDAGVNKTPLRNIYIDLNNSAFDNYNESKFLSTTISSSLASAESKLDDIQDKMSNAKELTENSRGKIATLQTSLSSISDNVNTVKQNLEDISRDINTIEITSSDQIVNPISTTIQTISSENNQLMILFPYVLMLIIMFVGLMLSSTLVIVEKKTKASFRVFTTATRDEFFILTTFVTAFIIVALQAAIILGVVSYFLVNIFTANLLVNSIVLILGTSIFIMIGMAVGYLMSNQQGSNMTSISIGAVFLFISNLVIPLESISPHLQKIAQFNPYVLSSEILRQSILFNVKISEVFVDLSVLLGFSILIFCLIIVSQKLSKMRYFHHNPHIKSKKNHNEQGIWIKNVKIKTEKEFIAQVRNLTEDEFNKLVKKKSHRVQHFIKKDLNKPLIAKKLRKLSKAQLINEFVAENKRIIEAIQKTHRDKKVNNKLK